MNPLADAFHWAKPWEWTAHTLTVLTALGTTGAVIVALALTLSRWVFERGSRPRLDLWHEPSIDASEERLWHVRRSVPAAFIRLGISNEPGRRTASGVQVLVVKVERFDRELAGEAPPWDGPLSNLGILRWTHVDPPELSIGPGLRRTVDLGWQEAQDRHFTLAVVPPPRGGNHHLTPGEYRIILAVGGANADAQYYSFRLAFDGLWDLEAPVSEHIQITEGPRRVLAPGPRRRFALPAKGD